MPSLRPFRKSPDETQLDQQPQKKGPSMRGLFQKKKKKGAENPVSSDEEVSLAVTEKKSEEEITGPTEHTVTSVGSDVTSEASEEDVDVAVPTVQTKEEPVLEEVPKVETPAQVVPATPKEKSNTADDNAPACYLVYEPDSSGRLVEHYSKTPVQNAVGRWTPQEGKKIAGFKLTRNAGRNVLIGSCSAGVQGRKNYCNGWCQFVKSCRIAKGDVTLWN
ncbi:MAG: hypothetical protein SGILL_008090, partial [Bacillariaceae sp.]